MFKTRDRIYGYFVGSLITLYIGFLAYVISQGAPAYPRGDNWRFIKIYLEPWYNKSFAISDLWANHHPFPLKALAFILNADIFGLRMDIESFSGLIFLSIAVFFLAKRIQPAIDSYIGKRSIMNHIPFFMTFFILLSPHAGESYFWSLALFNRGSIFLTQVLFLCYVDSFFVGRRKETIAGLFAMGLTIFAVCIMTSRSANMIMLGAVFGFMTFFLLVFKEKRYFKYILLASVIIAGTMVFYKLFPVNYKITTITERIFDNPFLILKSCARALFCGVIMPAQIKIDGLFDILSIIYFGLGLAAIGFFFINKIYTKTCVPIILLLYVFLYALSAVVFRGNPCQARYVLSYKIGVWSIYVIFFMVLSRYKKAGLLCLFTIMFLGVEILGLPILYKKAKYLRGIHPSVEVSLYHAGMHDFEISPPFWVVGHNKEIEKRLGFLRNNNLSIFSDTFPASPFLAEQKKRYSFFVNSTANPLEIKNPSLLAYFEDNKQNGCLVDLRADDFDVASFIVRIDYVASDNFFITLKPFFLDEGGRGSSLMSYNNGYNVLYFHVKAEERGIDSLRLSWPRKTHVAIKQIIIKEML
jgi:hypothetical protein